MFYLLIERGMDNFLVIELRDALMAVSEETIDPDEARKYVYRQVHSFERKGWLTARGIYRSKRYKKTDLFHQTKFVPRQFDLNSMSKIPSITADRKPEEDIAVLLKEKKHHEGKLAVALGEVEEYQSLINRFPNSRELLLPLFSDAKECSARLVGKINAMSKALKASGFTRGKC